VIVTVGSKYRPTPGFKSRSDRAINYKTEDFVAEVKAATGGRGAMSFSTWSAAIITSSNYDSAAMTGRVVHIAFSRRSQATVNFCQLMVKKAATYRATPRWPPVAYVQGCDGRRDRGQRCAAVALRARQTLMDSNIPAGKGGPDAPPANGSRNIWQNCVVA